MLLYWQHPIRLSDIPYRFLLWTIGCKIDSRTQRRILAMSRLWCPALAADACATFDTAHLGERPQSPGPEQRTKLVSAHAAHVAAAAQQKVYDAANKVASSPPSKFSSKVASSSSRQREDAPQLSATQPPVPFTPSVADEAVALQTGAIPRAVLTRSLAHLQGLPLEDTSRLAHIDLSRVDATTEELAGLFHQGGVLNEGSLQALTIRHSIRGTLGVQAILKALSERKGAPPLTTLDIACNPAAFSLSGEEPNVPCVDELVKYLAANESLRTLNLSATGLGAAGATAFPALKTHSGITSLDVSRNGIGLQQDEAAISALIGLVQENKFLMQLDLSDNEIGGPLAKQLLEALRTSDTRAKTPEVEPEPEVEEYTDEVPPEEEAPQVTVGFPEEASPAAADGEPTDGAAAVEESAEPPAQLDVTAEPEGDEDGDGEATATGAAADEAAAEEDPEAAEAARLEAEEAALEAARQKEEAWRAKMNQFIWEPEQVLFLHKESVTRRDIIVDYVNSTMQLKKTEKAAKIETKNAQLSRERMERDRRSGWSHLQDINLSGNPIGNAGAKILALLLRHKIPLTAEEQQAAEENYEKRLQEAKDKEREDIKKERAKLKAEEAAALAAAQTPQPAPEASPTPAEEGEVAASGDVDATDVAVEDDVIPPPADDEAPAAAAQDDAAENEEPKEGEEGGAEDDIDVSHVQVAAAESTRPGIHNIRGLRLDSCSIGSAGLAHVANAVHAAVCPSLTHLSLRRNKFAIKKKSVAVPAAESEGKEAGEEGEEEGEVAATMRVDMPEWVSPGLVALTDALTTCANLTVLDLGWNRMYPESIRMLSSGIRANRSLTFLGLDGNHIGFTEEGAHQSALAVLLEAVATQGLITTLLLGCCELESSLKEIEITLLATIPELQHLNLSGNQLTASSLAMWGNIALNLDDDVPRTALVTLLLEGIVSLEGEDGGAAVASVLQNYRSTLKTLSLKSCQQLGDPGVTKIAAKFSALTSLEHVNLSRCGIVGACEVVATAVSLCLKTLVSVDISDNEIPTAEFQQALDAMQLSAKDLGAIPLQCVSAWSRSGDSEDLLPPFLALAAAAPNCEHCDVGIPPVFPKATTAQSEDPNTVYEDLFDELERQCLKNRVRNGIQE